MDGIGGDDIELLARGEDKVPRIVVDQTSAPVVKHLVILGAEKFVGGRRDHPFQFAYNNALDIWIRHKGSCSNTSPESDHEDRFGFVMKQCRQVSHHALQSHVQQSGGSFRFAPNIKESLSTPIRNHN